LLEGDVTSEPCSPDALSAEEAAAGLILACRARPVGDVRIRWIADAPTLAVQRITARVAGRRLVARDVVMLTLSLPEGAQLNFLPGQFAKLRFGNLPERSYSMASQPGERDLVFHIKVQSQGLASGYVAAELSIGDPVEVVGPFGEAFWQGPTGDPLLLLAGGTGMAPMLSILDAAIRDGQAPEQIFVYHGVRSEDDLYAGDSLHRRAQQHGFRFSPVYSQPVSKSLRGARVHEAVAEHFGDLSRATIFASGPPSMVHAIKEVALRKGAPHSRIRTDPFFPAAASKPSLWQRITGRLRSLH
jgi:CDP-4-dehydro-6-deoxyglucose reductase/ferredoxin-NAD(P)+ reductase (naphthalene dioxygenase ferredoxin-specific)